MQRTYTKTKRAGFRAGMFGAGRAPLLHARRPEGPRPVVHFYVLSTQSCRNDVCVCVCVHAHTLAFTQARAHTHTHKYTRRYLLSTRKMTPHPTPRPSRNQQPPPLRIIPTSSLRDQSGRAPTFFLARIRATSFIRPYRHRRRRMASTGCPTRASRAKVGGS